VFVLGHLVTLHESRAFPRLDLDQGEHGMTAMLPDMLSCHDWGYSNAWRLAGAGVQAELVLGHMLGDAVVHYGARWTGLRRKSGWAYLRMGLVTRRFDEFHDYATAAGWRPAGLPTDSRRGWAHTLVEYSLDQWLADHRDLSLMHRAVRAAATDTSENLSWVHGLVAEHVIETSKPLATQPYRYCGALIRSAEPDEMHLRGLALKFQLEEHPDALDWLRGWLREICHRIGDDEMRDVVRGIADATADPIRHGYPLEIASLDRLPFVGNGRWGLHTTGSETEE
jgi:hypothetical protein